MTKMSPLLPEPPFASFLHRSLPSGLEGLADLALDLRWTGSQESDRLWALLDPETWERTENPFLILLNVSQTRLQEAASEAGFKALLRAALEERRRALDEPGWFSRHPVSHELKSVAYFSMEFGLTEALPIYSGGLGMLAGDFLKTASDMGVPITGIGLLYQQGYFRQILDADGWQLEAFPYNDPTALPVTPVQRDGGWLRVSVWLPGRTVLLRVWQAHIGRTHLYLLDSNDPLNSPWDRGLTATLYPSGQERGQERRLIQEIVLGIGGWNVLEALGIEPDICHLNEGHAAFVTIARARSYMRKTGLTFAQALWATRAGNVFTTHTAVPAGFDRFDPGLISQYARYFAETVGIPMETLLDMGREAPGNASEMLNIAYFAMRSVGQVNGVSRLHQSVSQRTLQPLFPRWPQREVPIQAVTNGVHLPSWDSDAAERLWRRASRQYPLLDGKEEASPDFEAVSDTELWNFRAAARQELIAYIRRRLTRQVHEHAASPETLRRAAHVLDPNALTLGFARRFAGYKRPHLLLTDPERLVRLLHSADRPVQLIVAGKAHPNDHEGKLLVQAMARFAARPDIFDRLVYLEDYDIALMQPLAAGIDLWINTPLRPWEACGTSGMKLLVNGGLNLSERDGWWAEAYAPEVGWALGDGQEHTEPDWNAQEAAQLYALLEEEVVPEFYDRDAEGLPRAWIRRVRASLSRLTPQFSSCRMLREYVENLYAPAVAAYQHRTANGSERAIALQTWQSHLAEGWDSLRFGELRVHPQGDEQRYEAQVYLGDLTPEDVRVELYAEPDGQSPDSPIVLERKDTFAGAVNGHIYGITIPAVRPPEHYTLRIVAFHPDALLPLEDNHILWREGEKV